MRTLRQWLIPVLLLVAVISGCGGARMPAAAETFVFAVASDTHIGRDENAAPNMTQAVSEINESPAEFTLFLGDLVEDGGRAENDYATWAKIAGGLRQPYYAVPGNHDAVAGFTKHLRPETDYAFDHKGWRFVCFNNSGTSRSRFEVTPAQVAWIRGQLDNARQKGQRVILAAHFPWFTRKVPGDSGSVALQELLKDHREEIAAFFCGHLHVGLRGMVDEPGIQAVAVPSTCYNRNPGARGALGWAVEEFRPAYVLVELRADKMVLTCKPIGAPAAAQHELPLSAIAGGRSSVAAPQ